MEEFCPHAEEFGLATSEILAKEELDASKYIANLEKWKTNEKEQFLDNLKKIENNFLQTLFEEWRGKRKEEELKLKWSIEECGRLSRKLEEGYSKLKKCLKSDAAPVINNDTNNLEAEQKKVERLEAELREEREENKVLRNRIREMDKTKFDSQSKEEMALAIVCFLFSSPF